MRRIALLAVFLFSVLNGCGGVHVSLTDQPSRDDLVLGPCPSLTRNSQNLTLSAGTYEGHLSINGNHHRVEGRGPGRTIVKGDLLIRGNKCVVTGLTIMGDLRVTGNSNDLRGTVIRGIVDVKGQDNRYQK